MSFKFNKPFRLNDYLQGASSLSFPFFASNLLPAIDTWSNTGTTTVDGAPVDGPDGTMTARRIRPTAGSGQHVYAATVTGLPSAEGYYPYQVWMRGAGYNSNTIAMDNGGARSLSTNDLTTGLWSGATGANIIFTDAACAASLRGYFRCRLICFKPAGATSVTFSIRLNGSASFAGDITKGVDVWSPQAILSPPNVSLAAPAAGAPVIISTDMFTDVDDIVGIRLANKAADLGLISIKAVLVDLNGIYSAPAVKAMMIYSGRGSVPVGAWQGGGNANGGPFTQIVRDAYRPGETRADYLAALGVFRQALANEADGTVTVIGMGSFQNLYDLLMSPADGISPLTGMQLVAAKVKRLISMAGIWPSGNEYNMSLNPAASAYVIANWPSEIVGVPSAPGGSIYTNIPLDANPAVDPYKLGFDNMPGGYAATLSGVLTASIGSPGSGGTDGVYDIVPTGGAGVNAIVRVTVAGGVVTAARVAAPGLTYTSAPTVSLAAIPGLTGASVTTTFGNYAARSSWDPMAIYLAIFGIDSNHYVRGDGTNVINATTGDNAMLLGEPGFGRFRYTFPRITNGAMGSLINKYL